MKTCLLYAGQGSQYVGMLKDINEKYPKAQEMIKKADEILGYKLSEICFDGPIDTLKETRYTQPALFLHEAVVTELVKDNLEFDAVAGHSVGEYGALFAVGVLSFEDALKLVSLRGNLMFEAGEYKPGTMFAVISRLEDSVVEDVCKKLTDEGNGNVVVAANYNSPGQVVVSGSAEYLRDNVAAFKEAGAKIVKELVVSGAFHSPLMESAKEELAKAINDIEFKEAKVPVYSNVYAKPLSNAKELQEALIAQLTSPVRWTQSMVNMKENGLEKFIEIGPGNVLQGLTKRTISDVEISGIDTAVNVENFIS
jgi:[acyl-carrier-protein] S-malonyltransferase